MKKLAEKEILPIRCAEYNVFSHKFNDADIWASEDNMKADTLLPLTDYRYFYNAKFYPNMSEWRQIVDRIVPLQQIWKFQIEIQKKKPGEILIHAARNYEHDEACIFFMGKFIKLNEDNPSFGEFLMPDNTTVLYAFNQCFKIDSQLIWRLQKIQEERLNWHRYTRAEAEVSRNRVRMLAITNDELGLPDFSQYV